MSRTFSLKQSDDDVGVRCPMMMMCDSIITLHGIDRLTAQWEVKMLCFVSIGCLRNVIVSAFCNLSIGLMGIIRSPFRFLLRFSLLWYR